MVSEMRSRRASAPLPRITLPPVAVGNEDRVRLGEKALEGVTLANQVGGYAVGGESATPGGARRRERENVDRRRSVT